MKRILIVLMSFMILQACNDSDQGGTVDDGFKGVGDPNGALPDTLKHTDPAIDSTRGEDRVDTERRDSI